MKVAVLTFPLINNYGGIIQAYALMKLLKSLGHEPFLVNLQSEKFYKSFVKYIVKKYVLFFSARYKNATLLDKSPILKSFIDKEINPKTDEVYSTGELIRLFDRIDFDACVVGSDQVWNPGTNTNIEPYFLTFAPKDKLKIAFASSFGVDKIDLGYKNKYKSLLNNLDFIGVREQSGVNIVDSLTEKQATLVLDPTFLLDKEEWLSFSTKTELKKPYLLMYVLTDSDYMTNIAKTIAKEKKLQIVRICKNAFVEDKSADVINIIDAGPKEYLGLFSKASFVLTTSFHGTCFSLNFNIPFYTILKKNKVNNSRQIDLLEYLGIGERILFVGDKIKDVKKLDINYSLVNEKLELKKEISINFLKKALKK